jgi:hypothetical protein
VLGDELDDHQVRDHSLVPGRLGAGLDVRPGPYRYRVRKQQVTIKTGGRVAIIVTVKHEDETKRGPTVNLESRIPDDEANIALALGVGFLAEKLLKATGERPDADVTIDIGDTGPLVAAIQAQKLRRAGN